MALPEYHYHPDGLIYVRTATGTYGDTLANFALDYGLPDPGLPAGAIQRLYDPGIRHNITFPTGGDLPQPLPWAFGDAAIADIAALLAAQTKRQAAVVLTPVLAPPTTPTPIPANTAIPTTLAQAQAQAVAALRLVAETTGAAGFTSSALGSPYTYPSSEADNLNLNGSITASLLPTAAVAGWTTDYLCTDSTGNAALRPHTAAQIQQVGIDAKAFETGIVAHLEAQLAQVAAATTIAAAEAVTWS
jgi:hypothetical protein